MSDREWPVVVDEFGTLFKLSEGYSIARFGDGELKMMDGAEYVREPANAIMAAELKDVFQRPNLSCIRGIPTMIPTGPKTPHWRRHTGRFFKYLPKKGTFYSAFISRPDNAPWINCRGFALAFRQLWMDKSVVILSEPSNSVRRAVKHTRSIAHLDCPHAGAYEFIDHYEDLIHQLNPQLAILSCGPTATCLANRLAGHGIQAIDFGSGGGFLAKLLKDE